MNIFNISGTPAQIGEQLGQLGKTAWHTKIKHTELWQQLQPFQHSEQILALQQLVYADFPEIWEEIVGLAKGLDDDVMTVFLWNCRGDVLSSTFDGCTTIIGKNTQGHTIVAHNEDGLPELIDDCFLVNATTSEGVSFFSFAYPASLCGHTFSVNCFGIVNTVNNLRIKTKNQGYPRQILARAALNQTDIQDVLNLLLYARVGGFHHTLVQKKPHQKTCALSVEALGQRSQVVDVQEIGLHANHVIYDDSTEQIITRSSKERQHRLESLFDGQTHLTHLECLQALFDTSNNRFPIYRASPFDSDHENTIATVIFTVQAGKVAWELFRKGSDTPENKGEVCLMNQ